MVVVPLSSEEDVSGSETIAESSAGQTQPGKARVRCFFHSVSCFGRQGSGRYTRRR